jgi:hypothetical protein
MFQGKRKIVTLSVTLKKKLTLFVLSLYENRWIFILCRRWTQIRKRSIRYHLMFFCKFSSCFFWHILPFLLYFTRIYNCVTESDGIKSHFHCEISLRNSKITVRKQHKSNFKQLHNKNVKINVWIYSRLKLISVTRSSATGYSHLSSTVPTTVS